MRHRIQVIRCVPRGEHPGTRFAEMNTPRRKSARGIFITGKAPLHPGADTKGASLDGTLLRFAEGEGFEPPEPCSSTVFKTAAIDHSAILPDDKSNMDFPFRQILSRFSHGRCRQHPGLQSRDTGKIATGGAEPQEFQKKDASHKISGRRYYNVITFYDDTLSD